MLGVASCPRVSMAPYRISHASGHTNRNQSHRLRFLPSQGSIKQEGVNAVLFHSLSHASKLFSSIYIDQGQSWLDIKIANTSIHDGIGAVWWRRPVAPIIPTWVHKDDAPFAGQELRLFLHSLWCHLGATAFWVNPYRVVQAQLPKSLQQRAAIACGFDTPATLYSNDPAQIKKFIDDQKGCVVYKAYGQQKNIWRDEAKTSLFQLYTTEIEETDLPSDALLAAVPGIYQEIIPKAYELRVTVMGYQIFAVQVCSQENPKAKVDWRRDQLNLQYKTIQIPREIANRCLSVCQHLDIVLGCIDLAVTPDGRYVFFEVNEAGQFLWLEDVVDLPLLDAFAEFLKQGRPDFAWEPSGRSLRVRDIAENARRKQVEDIEIYSSEVEKR